jgi:hypothetical protein
MEHEENPDLQVTKEEPVLTRAFRWTLEPKEDKFQVACWCISVHVDYLNKYVTAEFIDDAKGQIWEWLNSLQGPNTNLELVLTNFDQYGRPVCGTYFTGCRVNRHTTCYNYTNTEPLLNYVIFDYEEVKRVNDLHIQ